jgi:hypothetical protein
MPYADQLSGQPLRSWASFHADQRFGRQIEEWLQGITRKLGTLDHSTFAVDGHKVKHAFADVDPIGGGFGQGFGSHPFSHFGLRCSDTDAGVRGGPSHQFQALLAAEDGK